MVVAQQGMLIALVQISVAAGWEGGAAVLIGTEN
jgi:hypothetical protein